MERQVQTRQRVIDHGEGYTREREVNAMLDLVKQETERIDSRFFEPGTLGRVQGATDRPARGGPVAGARGPLERSHRIRDTHAKPAHGTIHDATDARAAPARPSRVCLRRPPADPWRRAMAPGQRM